MMSIGDLIPPEFFHTEKKDEMIDIIKKMNIPPRRKKQALIEWAKFTQCELAYEDFVNLLGISTTKM